MSNRNRWIITIIFLVAMIMSAMLKQLTLFNIFFPAFIYLVLTNIFKHKRFYISSFLSIGIATICALIADFGKAILKISGMFNSSNYISKLANYLAENYRFTSNTILIFAFVILSLSFIEVAFVSKDKAKYLFSVFTTNVFIMILLGLAFNNNIRTVYYKVESDKLNGKQVKIAHISDTHSTIYKNNQLINKVKKENPDIILLTGDIADDQAPIIGTEMMLRDLEEIAPIYYVTGNHEYFDRNYKARIESITNFNVIYLDDETDVININGNNILLAGINDPQVKWTKDNYENVLTRLENLSDTYNEDEQGYFKILLSHRPELIDTYAEHDYELILTGHAHGGQIRIPFLLNGLFAPNQDFFPKYAGGIYDTDNQNGSKMVVSRGLSIDNMPRIFNPPELVIITIDKTL